MTADEGAPGARRDWHADIELDEGTARRCVEGQFPELAPLSLVALGEGWDNRAWVVNEAWVFRFPRRRVAVALLERELAALPQLAPALPVAVPRPRWIGRASEEYPFPFAGYRRIEGETACSRDLSPAGRAALAAPLGRFLRALHAAAPPEHPDPGLIADPFGKEDLPRVLSARRPVIERLRAQDPGFPSDRLEAELTRLAETTPFSGPRRWVHGDLHGRHLLLDGAGALAGVIDWGDVALGDPALDLSVVFSLLPPAARPEFLAAYGGVEPDVLARARFRALSYAPVLRAYGLERPDEGMLRLAAWILEGAL